MKAAQSDLFRRMVQAGVHVNSHIISGEPIVFEGVVYTTTKTHTAGDGGKAQYGYRFRRNRL